VTATAILVAGATSSCSRSSLNRRPTSRAELQALITAIGTTRPLEGRVAGGFHFGQLPSVRGTEAQRLSPDVRIAVASIEKAAILEDTTANRAALAVADLVSGDLDQSVEALEGLVAGHPSIAIYQNDLAAAYLERSRRHDRAGDLARAVTAAERAVRLDSSLVEARFNRALGLQHLFLKDEARAAWADLLPREADREWTADIRQRLAGLDQPTAVRPWPDLLARITDGLKTHDIGADRELHQQRELAREWIEDQALAAWGREWIRGDRAQAAHTLAQARLIADALVRVDGDRMPAAGIACIDRLQASSRAGSIDDLAGAHETFGRARVLFLSDRLSEAAGLLTSVEPIFARTGSPYLYWSYVYRSFAARSMNRGDDALALVNQVPAEALAAYRYLRGRALWATGVVEMSASHIDLTEQHYRAAYQAFDEGGEAEMKAAMAALLAEDLFYLGRSDEAWKMERLAVSEIDKVRTAARRYTVVYYGYFLATSEDLPEVAMYYLNALLRNARLIDDRAGLPEALFRRARVADQLGDTEQAERDVDAASAALERVVDPGLRERYGIEIGVTRAQIGRQRHTATSRADLSAALGYFRTSTHSLRVVRLLLTSGRLAQARGDDAAAERDYLDGIREFEQQRSAWPNDQTRLASFDEAWSLFDEAIGLAVKRGDVVGALEIAERGRARALLDSLDHAAASTPPQIATVQARLPSSAVVLYYAVLARETLIWTVTMSRVELSRVPVGRVEVEQLIRDLNAAIQRRRAATIRRDAQALYRVLIAPVAARLGASQTLAIVGDGVVQRAPFAALIGPDGRYLIESRDLVWAPSLAIVAPRLRPASHRGGGAVLVAAPAGATPSEREGLPALPDAFQEAGDIARLYRDATLLTGSALTPETFEREAPQYSTIHFAGHGIVNERYPALSRLVMGPTVDGGLFSFQIASHPLTATNLVVLASCSGAAGPTVRGEGVLSLVRPFLAAGVPAIVAAQWALPDRAARLLFTAFHADLSHGSSVATSLRRAQLVRLSDPDSDPRDWAGVIAVGHFSDLVNVKERD
jgi:CHAT domain-containing protein